jgi:Glycosyltransferase family 87
MCSTGTAIGELPAAPGSRSSVPERGRRLACSRARAATAGDARWGWLFAVFGVVAAVEIMQVVTAFFGNESLLWFHQDFPALYAAGKMVASGSGALLYDTGALADAEIAAAGHPVGGTGVLAYFNPPFFAGMMAPLSALSLDRAYQVWTLFSVALLASDCWLLCRIAAGLPRRWRIALVVGFVTLYPVSYGVELGQFSLVLVTSWAAAYLLLRNERDALAGLALAPLLIKPELLLPVAAYLLWKRRWRVFSTLAPASAIAIVASIAIVGAHSALAYPVYLLDSTKWSGEGVASNVMFDWNGIAAMFWGRPHRMRGWSWWQDCRSRRWRGWRGRGAARWMCTHRDSRRNGCCSRWRRCWSTRICTCRTACSSRRRLRRCSRQRARIGARRSEQRCSPDG